jgi:transcription initiation factor TFIIIB Brf1 subunit/transcription initiation factor TFIIB
VQDSDKFDVKDSMVYIKRINHSIWNRNNIMDCGSNLGYYEEKYHFYDYSVKILDAKNSIKFMKLKDIDIKSKINNNPTLFRVIKIIKSICSNLGIQKYSDYICDVYRRCKKENIEIKNNVTLAAYCVYSVIRSEKLNISIDDIVNSFEVFAHRVNKQLLLAYGMKFNVNKSSKPKSIDYIQKMFNTLIQSDGFKEYTDYKKFKVNEEYIQKILDLSSKILQKIKDTNRNPINLAAACIYASNVIIAHKQQRTNFVTQELISKNLNVAEFSLRDCYQFIKNVCRN